VPQGSAPALSGAAGDHRRRIVAAMVEAAAADGYRGATVSRVVELAGVSKTTFYEQFRDRDECFAAAYGSAVEAVETGCRESEAGRPDAVLASLLSAASTDPALARLLLIECHGGPLMVRARHQRLLNRMEQAATEMQGWRLQMPAAALQGGLSTIVASALLRGEEATLIELLPQLTAWLGSYQAPPGAQVFSDEDWSQLGRQLSARLPGLSTDLSHADQLLPPHRRRLPRGRSAASPAHSAADRRQRLLEATAEAVSLKGYPAATVADIVAAAGVTRGAFYSHFRCKLDAFLAVLTQNLQESVAAVAAQFFVGERWPDRVWNGLEAFLRYSGEHWDAAHLGIVEIYAAGEAAIRRAGENRSAFTLFLADGYHQSSQAMKMPPLCSDAIAGAVEGMLRRQLLAGEGHRALELLPRCAYVALAPFIGSGAASDLVLAKCQGAPPEPETTSWPDPAPPFAAGSDLPAARA
jgi:AcrR family transcriptional regulator